MALSLSALLPPASPALAASQWVSQRHILYLYPDELGMTFKLDGDRINIGSPCESIRIWISKSSSNYDAIVSTLPTAFAMNVIVDVNYDDATITSCHTVANHLVAYR